MTFETDSDAEKALAAEHQVARRGDVISGADELRREVARECAEIADVMAQACQKNGDLFIDHPCRRATVDAAVMTAKSVASQIRKKFGLKEPEGKDAS